MIGVLGDGEDWARGNLRLIEVFFPVSPAENQNLTLNYYYYFLKDMAAAVAVEVVAAMVIIKPTPILLQLLHLLLLLEPITRTTCSTT